MNVTKSVRKFLPLLVTASPNAYAQESGEEEDKPKIRGHHDGQLACAERYRGWKKVAIIPVRMKLSRVPNRPSNFDVIVTELVMDFRV
jgi:hypothetical protein